MSVLNPDEIATLLRARFTQREVNTQRIKFYNLFRIYPFLSDEVERQRKRDQMHDELVAALTVARNRLADMLMNGGDDDRAWKEARKAMPEIEAALAAATGEQK